MDWFHDMIGHDGQPITAAQMTLRGLVLFAYGLAVVRFAGHRIFGKMGAFDIVLSVIVGSNLSRCLTGNAPFLPTIAATTGLIAAHWLLARLAVHSKAIGWVIKGSEFCLVRDGQPNRRAMVRHGISEGDLAEAARLKGQEKLDHKDQAFLERNGSISIINKD